MIIGILHKGSGIGDQLFSYIATRVRAADLDVDFGFVGKEFFKGAGFMNLDWGKETGMKYTIRGASGAVVPNEIPSGKLWISNKPYFDPEFEFIKDDTVIDGYGAQDERYWKDANIWDWIKTDINFEIDNNLCVINIRGGEYRGVPELFLPKSYFDEAIEKMKQINPNVKFEVHTDDLQLALEWFPEYKAIKDIAQNWQALRWANYAIISNSAFAVIPRHLAVFSTTIAPRFWAGRNVGEWRRPGNYYKKFIYV